MTDTEDEFKAATEGNIDESDLSGLTIVDDDEPIDLDDKLPEEAIIDPLAPEEDDEQKEDDELDDKAEIEAVMWQDYDER